MKLKHLLTAFSLTISGLAFSAGGHDHAHEHKPLHGGIVTEVKDVDYELVIKPELIQLFIRDHGKPVDVSQVSAKAVLLSGSEKSEIDMKPVGDKLEARSSFKASPGSKALITVTFPGNKTTTARFAIK